jgi:hypothetical protein
MSITTTATTSSTTVPTNSSSNDKLSSSSVHHSQHFINERYPKTCLEDIPSIILEYPPRLFGGQPTRSRHSLRFRTQPVTLTEINEHDEENKTETDQEQESQTTNHVDFQRLEHLALSEYIRRTARKKTPSKNFLERQRLKAMREDSNETDGN